MGDPPAKPNPPDEGAVFEAARRLRQRPDSLFEIDEAEQIVPLLPVQELAFAVQEFGIRDSVDLVALVTGEQLQSLFDLSLWSADRIDPTAAQDWISVLLELPDELLLAKLEHIDAELIEALVKHASIIWSTDQLPESEVAPYTTPDTFFALYPKQIEPVDPTDEPDDPFLDERYPLVVKLIDRCYRIAADLTRSLLTETLGSTLSELEDLSYRWRTGRLADLGYEEHAEALGLLQYRDPAAILRRFEAGVAPAAFSERADQPIGHLPDLWPGGDEEPFLRAGLQALDDTEVNRVTVSFTYLANRLAAATLAQAGDPDDMRRALTRARQRVNLGLEFLCRLQPARAGTVLRALPATEIFYAGHGLTLQLQRLVGTLGRTGRLSLASRGHTLLDPPWDELAGGLGARFPELTRGFDEPWTWPPTPKSTAGATLQSGVRAFTTLRDVAFATELVQDLGLLWPLCFAGLGIEPAWLTEERLGGLRPADPGGVTLGLLVRTAAVRHVLGEGFAVQPLGPDELDEAEAILREAPPWASIRAAIDERLGQAGVDVPDRLDRILTIWLRPLALGRLGTIVLRRG